MLNIPQYFKPYVAAMPGPATRRWLTALPVAASLVLGGSALGQQFNGGFQPPVNAVPGPGSYYGNPPLPTGTPPANPNNTGYSVNNPPAGYPTGTAGPAVSGSPTTSFSQPVGSPPVTVVGPGVQLGMQPPAGVPNAALYGATGYPGGVQPLAPGPMNQPLPPLSPPWMIDPNLGSTGAPPFGYNPNVRDVPLDVYVTEGQTGRFSVGGSVNSDLGVAGQIILEERNFDLFRLPGRPSDMFNGAFRGGGQNFRLELVPGNQVQRYTLNWTEPNLFGYSPFSLSVGGFYFTRFYQDWSEQRLGGRAALGYDVTPDLSVSTELRGEDVKVFSPRVSGVQQLDDVLGSNDLYTARFRLAHNTRDSPFIPTEGHLLEFIYDQVFGEYDFPRAQLNYSKYFLVTERADGSGRQTFTTAFRTGFAGEDQPLFENFFAGGYSTLRGFQFRGAGPVVSGVEVGGRFQFLGTFEYMFPITADDMLRMVTFVDFGTIEQDLDLDWSDFRVAPGLGLRVAVPALGPAPLAFDFAVPVAYADSDTRQVFSFSAGITR
jgi:outer membrane protein insertion porin family